MTRAKEVLGKLGSLSESAVIKIGDKVAVIEDTESGLREGRPYEVVNMFVEDGKTTYTVKSYSSDKIYDVESDNLQKV